MILEILISVFLGLENFDERDNYNYVSSLVFTMFFGVLAALYLIIFLLLILCPKNKLCTRSPIERMEHF
jgi:hypothetical protein